MAIAIDQAPALQRSTRRRQFVFALRQPAIGIGAVVMLIFLLAALLAPLLAPYDPLGQNISAGLNAPSAAHLFGTDKLGRDIFSRILYGARISLFVGVAGGVIFG